MPTSQNPTKPLRLIKLTEVRQRTTLSKTTIYDLIRQGRFPPPVRLSHRSVAWPEADVDRWIDDRISGQE